MRLWMVILPIVTAVSWGVRLLPFFIAPYLRRFPSLDKLSSFLPGCLLLLITAHALHAAPCALPEFIALIGVLLTQFLFRTLLLSMGVGVALHQLLLAFG